MRSRRHFRVIRRAGLVLLTHLLVVNPTASAAPDPRGLEPETQNPKPETHWSFQPLRLAPIPEVHHRRWPDNDVDRFILARLETAGLDPGIAADKRTLIRRATFDLTGLPPTPEEIDAFLRDTASSAFARVIDRLLASTHYGERWGRHWLDVVRYADTAGDSADYPIPQAHRYRDYVIAAFNHDKPYDRFVQEQIAGDLMASEGDSEKNEQLTATGFIALSRRFGVNPAAAHHLTIEDTLDTIGRAVLGLSMSCARCHDHKFDPISMEDYYALYGIFASTRYPDPGSEERRYQTNFIPLIPPAEVEARLKPHREKLASLDEEIARLDRRIALLKKEDFAAEDLDLDRTRIQKHRDALASALPAIETAYAVTDTGSTNAHLQKRGEPSNPGEAIPRRFLKVFGGQTLPPDHSGSGRDLQPA